LAIRAIALEVAMTPGDVRRMGDARNSWREPTLQEILADEIVEALMAADRVDRHELQSMLTEVARNLEQTAAAKR
jgi:hypothetical protein